MNIKKRINDLLASEAATHWGAVWAIRDGRQRKRNLCRDALVTDVTALIEAARRSVDWMMRGGQCDECCGLTFYHIPGCWVGPVETALAAFEDGE